MIRAKPVKNHSVKVLTVDPSIFAVARSEIEAEEILYRYNIWNIYPSTETALPGAVLLGVGSLRWSESCISESVHLF
jgi:hypothetical protein